MAGISGNNIAEAMKKSYQNLINSEQVASSFTAFVDQQNSDKSAVIGPIKITLNNSDDETKVGELTDTGTESSIKREAERQKINAEIIAIDAQIVAKQAEIDASLFAPDADGSQFSGAKQSSIKRSTEEEKEQTFAKMHAEVEYLENVKKVEQVYVQDNEFGTYENNLTGQTVNREAELLFAKQNKIRDALNEELVLAPKRQAKAFEKAKLEAENNASELVAEMANDSLKAKILKENAIEKGKKQGALNDRLQNDRIDTIANLSDSAANKKQQEAKKNAKKLEKQIELDAYRAGEVASVAESAENLKKIKFELAKEKAAKNAAELVESMEGDLELEKRRRVFTDEERAADLAKAQKLLAQDAFMETVPDADDIVSAAYEPGNRTPNILTEEQIQANFKRQEEGFQDVISNTTAEDMQETIDIGSQQKVVKTSNTNSVRDAMEEQKKNLMADGSPNGRGNRKSQIKEKSPSFADTRDGSLTGKDPFRFSTLAYPESITTDPQYGHFILFYVNVQNKTKYSYRGYNNDGDEIDVGDKYQTSKLGFADDGSGRRPGSGGGSDYRMVVTEHTGAIEQGLASEVSYQKQQHLDGQLGSNHLRNNQVTLMKARKARAGIDTVLDLTTRITDSVAIYLPSAVNDNVKAGYQDFNTGFAGFVALSGGKILNQIADNDYEGAAKSFIGKGGDILKDLGKRAAIGTFKGLLSGDGVMESFDKAFGQTVNPFIEVAFDSMGVRTFNYTFDFRPKSSRETEEVRAIIQLFRFHMVPELKGSNHRYLTLPSTFDIHYMYQTNEASKENEFYSKIATCVLTGCDVNYTPDGVKSFESGAPTHITMSLNFMETEMLTKEKINDGF